MVAGSGPPRRQVRAGAHLVHCGLRRRHLRSPRARLGATYDLAGDGKTVVKADWGRFYFNPGVNLADSVNPNTANQYSDYVWNDLNNDRVYQEGEQGVLQTRFGGVANAAIDPDLDNSYTDEASMFVERAVMRDLGVRVGFVWKKDKNGWQLVNTLEPLAAFNVPVAIVDPGPDGVVATAADNGTFAFLNLDDTTRGSSQVTTNIDGYEGTYKTLEIAANKRYSQRWSLNASLSYTWTREFGNLYFNNRFGTAILAVLVLRQLPVDAKRAHRQRVLELEREVQRHVRRRMGTLRDAGAQGAGRRAVRAVLLGRRLLGNGPQQLFELRHPTRGRRADWHSAAGQRRGARLPGRKADRFAQYGKVGLFVDVFNALNADTAVNINWRSGASFEKATTVIGPRIVKFGVKFDW